MERLSDKAALKELIKGAGLSVIPGTKAAKLSMKQRMTTLSTRKKALFTIV